MSPSARGPADLHVLVAGAGGIGCPAARALAAAGVGRITLLDPDVVEPSNLPRQVLYHDGDIGQPKAPTAAARLDARVFAGGLHTRLDDANAGRLLAGVDVLIDATDGAHAKDWINQAAVRTGVPLVHAAGLRSEARLMAVPAGGRPCLACLFGRLTEETGSCADLGVWNGVVGVVGSLAAQLALRMALAPGEVAPAYQVLDFESGRAVALAAEAEAGCPVCARARTLEPYPQPLACAPAEAPAASAAGTTSLLDLREERCPLNLLRTRRALEDLQAGATLSVRLGEEGAATVPDGVRALGHDVLDERPDGAGLLLRVRARGGGAGVALEPALLQRFARQVVLPEVGEAGQQRLCAAAVHLGGTGPAFESARLYLRAAGVGEVTDEPREGALHAWAGGSDDVRARADVALATTPEGVRAVCDGASALGVHDAPPAVAAAWGVLLADLVQRTIVLGERAPQATFAIDEAGRVA